MSLHSLRARLARLIEQHPPVPGIDWRAVSGERPPADPNAEIVTGCGFSWEQAAEPTPITDVVGEWLSTLPLPLPPEEPPGVVPVTNTGQEPAFPPDAREPEGDDDAR